MMSNITRKEAEKQRFYDTTGCLLARLKKYRVSTDYKKYQLLLVDYRKAGKLEAEAFVCVATQGVKHVNLIAE